MKLFFIIDCCSSRILLLRDHTLKYVEEHRLQAHEQAFHYDHLHSFEKIPQHVDFDESSSLDFNKNYSSESQEEEDSNEDIIYKTEETATEINDRVLNISDVKVEMEVEEIIHPLGSLYDLTSESTIDATTKEPIIAKSKNLIEKL